MDFLSTNLERALPRESRAAKKLLLPRKGCSTFFCRIIDFSVVDAEGIIVFTFRDGLSVSW